jgi:large subunit ribosomal protein L25
MRCLPKDLPEKISVDVTALNIGDALHIRELTLPAGVRAKLDGNVVVVVVQAPKEEVAATPAAAAAAPAAGAAAPAAGAAKAADAKAAPAKK